MGYLVPPWRKCPRCGKDRFCVRDGVIACETLGCGRLERDDAKQEIGHERGWLRKLRAAFEVFNKED